MKLKHIALILSTIILSQAALAAAPLCRAVLISFSQEQIDSAIEEFTLLTIQTDKAQVNGDNTSVDRWLHSSKSLKEKELIEKLGISRDEFRKLVKTRNLILRKRLEDGIEAKKKAVANETELLRKETFKLEKHFDTNFSPGTTFEPVANGSKIFVRLHTEKWLMSLEDGTLTNFAGVPSVILPDAIFNSEKTATGFDFKITNLHTGSQSKTLDPQGLLPLASSDKQSVVFSIGYANTPFRYLQIDKNGTILNEGTLADIFGADVRYVGAKEWIIRGNGGYMLFNPHNKIFNSLNIDGSRNIADLHNGRIGINDQKTLHIVDTDTHQRISKALGADFEISFSSDKFVWAKFKDPSNPQVATLRSFDINTLEEMIDAKIMIEKDLEFTSLKNSNLVSTWSGMPGMNKTYKGIYRNDDLFTPIFDTAQIYSDKNITVKNQSLSDDGQSLIIVGAKGLPAGEKYFVDVWRLK